MGVVVAVADMATILQDMMTEDHHPTAVEGMEGNFRLCPLRM